MENMKELTIEEATQAFAQGKKVKCIVPEKYAPESCCPWDEGDATYIFNDVYQNGEVSYNGTMPLTPEMIQHGKFYMVA